MEYAYNPMREPRKEVTEEQMKETLARRVRESMQKHAERVSIATPGVTVDGEASIRLSVEASRPRELLQWDKPIRTSDDGLGYQRSTCGHFVIAKVRVKDTFQYTCSDCRHSPARPIGSFTNLAEAQRCCEGAVK